ncbi:MAG: hypothetical protein V3S04_00285 [Candidatus Omnitrophota bacterium]
MDKKRGELIMVAVLVFILLALSINAYSKYMKRASKAAPVLQGLIADETMPVVVKTSKAQAVKKLTWGRDPFRLLKTKAKANTRDLILNGVIWDQDNPYAIINGEVVVSGDYIESNLVVYIGKRGVILDSGSEQFELKVWE